MKNLLVILFAATFAFAACGGDNAASNAVNEATEAANDVANAAGDMANDAADATGDMVSDAADGVSNAFGGMSAMEALTSTVTAVKEAGGVTKLSPDAAVSNIDGWISTLGGMEGTDGIVGNLKTLKTELTKGNIDGSVVGPILIKLGDEAEALGNGNAVVNGLASALRTGGEKLSK